MHAYIHTHIHMHTHTDYGQGDGDRGDNVKDNSGLMTMMMTAAV